LLRIYKMESIKDNINDAYEKVFDATTVKLRAAYNELSNPSKRESLERLERFILKIRALKYTKTFNGAAAREAREERGLTYRAICSLTGIKSPQTIANYETRKVTPKWNNPSGELYLDWLKNAGLYDRCTEEEATNSEL